MITTILISALGFLLGMLANEIYHVAFSSVGTLKVYHKENKDLYSFEIADLSVLDKKKHVVLNVTHDTYISPK